MGEATEPQTFTRMKFALKNVRQNPFRDFSLDPIRQDQVQNLRESIGKHGFQQNIAGRVRDGKAEIAAGHHRLEALKKQFGTDHEIELLIGPFTDAQMIQLMQSDNDAMNSHDIRATIANVKATVIALGAGKISSREMPVDPNTPETRVRYAPSFVKGTPNSHRYTVRSLATFLQLKYPSGEPRDELKAALKALEFEERTGIPIMDRIREAQPDLVGRSARTVLAYLTHQQQLMEQEKEQRIIKAQEEVFEARRRKHSEEYIASGACAREVKEMRDKIEEKNRKEREREELIRREGPKLEVAIEARKEREAAERRQRESGVQTRHAVNDVLKQLQHLREGSPLEARIKSVAQNKAVTPKERESLRQAILDTRNWMEDQAGRFLPPEQ